MATATGTAVPTATLDSGDVPPGFVVEDGRIIPWWYTRTGEIIKWSLFLGLSLILGVYIFGGYMHAKRRLRKGQKPLWYHRWLVTRQELATVDPRYAYPQATFTNYRPGPEYYGMQAMPPPIYDPSAPRPPVYDGPDGGTKVDPSQRRNEPTHRPGQTDGDFAPPPGPPPVVAANHTGTSTTSNNPYRP